MMSENDDIFSDMGRLVIGAGAQSDTPTQPAGPTLAAGKTQNITSAGGSGVCGAEATGPEPVSVPPAGDTPPTPWTALGLIEFEALWTNQAIPISALAKHYRRHVRTIHRWRQQVGLLPRRRMVEQGIPIARTRALLEQAVAPVLSPGARELIVKARSRVFYFPWQAP